MLIILGDARLLHGPEVNVQDNDWQQLSRFELELFFFFCVDILADNETAPSIIKMVYDSIKSIAAIITAIGTIIGAIIAMNARGKHQKWRPHHAKL